ncbi:hypothetical protein C6A85_85090 [Mycobacterium sp. ITM-2017-0098]|nr:hypothetical protein C6A85_85090 [Mycobacterium sp. ITM-2017-0098]
MTVTTERPPGPGESTANDFVAASNAAACARPANGWITPGGGSVTGGESAAWAAGMVGGGASTGLDEQPAISAMVNTAPPTRYIRTGEFMWRNNG